MSAPRPTVSVVVTAYNQEAYIGDALRSVLAQTYQDYEVVVVDDGSTDRTADEIGRFGARVRLIRQANQGIAGSRNTGVLQARGRLVAFMDGDDFWEPGKLARQVAAAEQSPSAGLIVVNGTEVGSPAGLRSTLFPPQLDELLVGKESVTLRGHEMFLYQNPVCTMSQVMVPREVLDDVGPSDPAFPISSDWDLYIRIAARYEVTFLSARLATWRYLESSASGPRTIRQLRWGGDGLAVLQKHRRAATSPETRALIRSRIRARLLTTANTAYYFGKAGARPVARRHLLKLLRGNPEHSGMILFFLVGLHSPAFLTRSMGRFLRGALHAPIV